MIAMRQALSDFCEWMQHLVQNARWEKFWRDLGWRILKP